MFELYQSPKSKEYYFRLKAKNGQTILGSEGYKTKKAAENGINSVKQNAGNAARYETAVARNGKHRFNLKASNGQVIGTSQMYTSTSGCKNGMESVKKNAPGDVNDLC